MTGSRISRELVVAAVASVGVHAVWLAREAKASSSRAVDVSEVSLESPTPRPPPEEVKPAVESPTTNLPPEPVARAATSKAAAAQGRVLPSAAAAGKTLTMPEDQAGSDIADFTLVQGEGTSYVGGTTSSVGRSRVAVRGPANDAVAPAARAGDTQVPANLPDRSRSATPAVPAWDCSRLFPGDADAGDYATVLIAVSVGVDGSPKRVAMLRDPGHGFGAAAIQCAMSQRYHVAFDREGRPVAATTPPIVVRFSR